MHSAAKNVPGYPVSQPEKAEEKGTRGHGNDSISNVLTLATAAAALRTLVGHAKASRMLGATVRQGLATGRRRAVLVPIPVTVSLDDPSSPADGWDPISRQFNARSRVPTGGFA